MVGATQERRRGVEGTLIEGVKSYKDVENLTNTFLNLELVETYFAFLSPTLPTNYLYGEVGQCGPYFLKHLALSMLRLSFPGLPPLSRDWLAGDSFGTPRHFRLAVDAFPVVP